MDYINIFLTLPNPANVDESTTTTLLNSPSPSDSSNSESSQNDIEAEADNSSECELTNLNWLTDFKAIGNLHISEPPPNPNPTIRFNKFITEIRRSREAFEKNSHVYRTNPHEKPPFNYAHIIGMAMMDKEMMTLKDICNWIKDNFAYYKYVGNWNNSIRHNLSLSVFFTKVARDKNEKGKGGYWKLAMDYKKTEKKRIRRNRNNNKSHKSVVTNRRVLKGRDKCLSQPDQITDNFITTDGSFIYNMDVCLNNGESFYETIETTEIIDEHDGISDLNVLEHEIFLEADVPQPIDEIALPFVFHLPQSGPNVITETIPQFSSLPSLDSMETTDFSSIKFNEYDELDKFLNSSQEIM